mgnify:CR=1 FL=1
MKEKCLCRGDFFELRNVRVLKTGETKCAKVFRKSDIAMGRFGAEIEKGYEFIERELKLLSRLDHPNLIKVHEALEDKHKIYFIMESIKGVTLFQKIIQNTQFDEV